MLWSLNLRSLSFTAGRAVTHSPWVGWPDAFWWIVPTHPVGLRWKYGLPEHWHFLSTTDTQKRHWNEVEPSRLILHMPILWLSDVNWHCGDPPSFFFLHFYAYNNAQSMCMNDAINTYKIQTALSELLLLFFFFTWRWWVWWQGHNFVSSWIGHHL